MTTRRRQLFACTRVLALGLAAWALGMPARAQQVMGEHDLYLQLSEQFSEAVAIFEDPQRQSQSIEFFGQILSAIEDERRVTEELPPELEELQERAYEYRAQANFNSGQLQGAADDFRQLILANPRYVLDENALSPKIIDFYEDQKKQLVGYIAVNSEPPGARVTVNGDFVGITNFFPIEVHTGASRVEVQLEGYEPVLRDTVEILPGEIRTLDFELVRNSAKLPVITEPSGVEVWVDGEQAGTTVGSLPPDLRSFMPAEFDPDRLSAPLDLAALPLGQHLIELRRDCYETSSFSINVEKPEDYTARIVKLDESIGQLRLTSNPAGARVFLDGEYKGNTPLDLNRVCSGTHHLEVKHSTGRYVEDVLVAKNEDLSLDCRIRPSLAFLGLVAAEGVPDRDLEDIRESITKGLQTLTAMNLILVPDAQTTTLLGGDRLATLVQSDGPGAAVPWERVRDLSERLGEALEVEALLVGYVPAQRLTKDVVFHLLASGSGTPDTFTLNYLDREALPRFVEELSTATPLYESWIGLTTIDTRTSAGPVVLRLASEGPAARAGLQKGDVVLSADGTAVSDTRALNEKVRAKGPESELALQIARSGSSSDVTIAVTVGTTPLEVPLHQDGFLYNKAIIDFRHRIVTEPSVEAMALLNLALCYMALGDFETPLREYFPRITLPAGAGISQGTVLYHTGVCYQQLEERGEAMRVFQEALSYPDATLQTNDGPRVVPLVERMLRELGQ